jgi:hypothetical protein
MLSSKTLRSRSLSFADCFNDSVVMLPANHVQVRSFFPYGIKIDQSGWGTKRKCEMPIQRLPQHGTPGKMYDLVVKHVVQFQEPRKFVRGGFAHGVHLALRPAQTFHVTFSAPPFCRQSRGASFEQASDLNHVPDIVQCEFTDNETSRRIRFK